MKPSLLKVAKDVIRQLELSTMPSIRTAMDATNGEPGAKLLRMDLHNLLGAFDVLVGKLKAEVAAAEQPPPPPNGKAGPHR